MAKSRTIGFFSLRVLEIARTMHEPSFAEIFTEYNRLYDSIPFDRFSGYVVEAFEMGYLKLGGAAVKGVDPIDRAVEIVAEGAKKGKRYSSYWTRIQPASILPGIESLKDELGVDLLRNANRDLFDALIRNQIYLLRLSGSIRLDIISLLNKTENDIAERIRRRLSSSDPRSLLGTNRLKLLEQSIRAIRNETWDKIDDKWVQELVDLAKSEVASAAGIMKTVSPAVLELVIPPASQLRDIVKTNPFEGKTLKQWASTIREQDIQRMLDQIRIGLAQGESSDAIARRIVGTARLNGSDGVTEITRRNAAAITRTAVNSIASAARDALYAENSDILARERYVATLDARTTPICRALDGKLFDLGKGPRPPLHFNCRSLRVPYFDGEAIGERPARAFTQKQMLREFAEAEGINAPAKRDGLPHGYKTLYDTYARRRMRELTSIVPGNETYQSWLSRQSATFQDDVLGPTRGRLFRRGGLILERFNDTDGSLLSLSDLARSHRSAFRAAGLDPEDFI